MTKKAGHGSFTSPQPNINHYRSCANSANRICAKTSGTQGPTINSVTLPSSIEFGYLQVSQENLPEQSRLDLVNTFAADLLRFISRPEVLILIIIAISVVAVFVFCPVNEKDKR